MYLIGTTKLDMPKIDWADNRHNNMQNIRDIVLIGYFNKKSRAAQLVYHELYGYALQDKVTSWIYYSVSDFRDAHEPFYVRNQNQLNNMIVVLDGKSAGLYSWYGSLENVYNTICINDPERYHNEGITRIGHDDLAEFWNKRPGSSYQRDLKNAFGPFLA